MGSEMCIRDRVYRIFGLGLSIGVEASRIVALLTSYGEHQIVVGEGSESGVGGSRTYRARSLCVPSTFILLCIGLSSGVPSPSPGL